METKSATNIEARGLQRSTTSCEPHGHCKRMTYKSMKATLKLVEVYYSSTPYNHRVFSAPPVTVVFHRTSFSAKPLRRNGRYFILRSLPAVKPYALLHEKPTR